MYDLFSKRTEPIPDDLFVPALIWYNVYFCLEDMLASSTPTYREIIYDIDSHPRGGMLIIDARDLDKIRFYVTYRPRNWIEINDIQLDDI